MTGHTILVVEDDPHFGQQLVDLFDYLGHSADLVTTGAEGLARFAERPASLVISDVMLPGMNGLEFVEALRERPDAARTPVLLMSAVYRDPRDFVHQIGDLDVLQFLVKPFSVVDLGQRVTEMLEDLEHGRDAHEAADVHLTGAAPALEVPLEFEGRLEGLGVLNLIAELSRGRLTGRLKLRERSLVRDLYFLDGHPVAADSDHPDEGLPALVVKLGMVTALESMELQAQSINERMSFQEATLRSGMVRARRLYHAERQQVRAVLDGALTCPDVSYHFRRAPLHDEVMGFFEVEPHSSLFTAARAHCCQRDLRGALRSLPAGELVAGSRDFSSLDHLDLGNSLAALREAVADGRPLSVLLKEAAPELLALIWLARALDVVRTPLAPVDKLLPAPPGADERAPSASGSPPLTGITARWQVVEDAEVSESLDGDSTTILTDYITLMRADLYRFLGLRRSATVPEIQAAGRQRLERYATSQLRGAPEPELLRKAQELRDRARMALETLSSDDRRASYDTRLRQLEQPHRKADGSVDLDPVRALMMRKECGPALLRLRRLRKQHPLDPTVLSLLGWCIFVRGGGGDSDLNESRRWVQRALDLDSSHRDALRYRLFLSRREGFSEDTERAERELRQRFPDDRWLDVTYRPPEI